MNPESTTDNNNNPCPRFLSGGGEMGRLTWKKDWSQTPVGPIEQWPQSLRTALGIILHSKFPMFIWWGPELVCFYNDAYRPSLGNNGKHPGILGQPAKDAWPEIWDVIQPLIQQVLDGGDATWNQDQLIPIYRNGRLEDVYWTFSYSAIMDDSGMQSGVLVTCFETTDKVQDFTKIAESKDQLEFAIEAAELGTFDYDPVTNKFTTNSRLKGWFGLPPQAEVELTDAIDAIAPEDRQAVTMAIEAAIDYNGSGGYDIEYKIIHPVSKKETYVRAKGRAWFNSDNIAYRFNGTLQDVTEEVQVRKRVEESEERFRTMAENTDILIAVADATNSPVYFNNAWMNLTGRSIADLLHLGWADLIHPDDKQGYINIYSKAFEKKQPFTGEFRLLNKDGGYSWLLAQVPPRFRGDGSFAGYISSFTDITDRKLTEDALKESSQKEMAARKKVEESEQRVRSLVESAPFPIGVYVGKEMLIQLANQSILEVWGKGNDVIGKLYRDLLPEVGQAIYDQLDHVYTSGLAYHARNQRVDIFKDGVLQPHYFNYSFTPLFDASGRVYGVMNTAADLTDLNVAKQKVEESEQRFRKVADSAPVFIWMSGTDKLCHYFNLAWLNFTGRNMEQEYGNGWAEGVHPDDLVRCFEVYGTAFDKRVKFYMEYRLKRCDGEYRWISDTGVPRITTDGVFEGYIGACMDIHDRIIHQKKSKENEDRLNIVISASELGTWELDLQTNSVKHSSRYAEIFGYPEDKIVEHATLYQQIHPEDMPIRNHAFADALSSGALHYESRILWQDGSVHWIDVKGKVFYDDDNLPIQMIGTIQDISQEKYHQQELQEREQKFRLLSNIMPQLVWTGDAAGNLNYFNQSVYEYSGLAPNVLEADGWLQIVHPDEQAENIKHWLRSIATGKDFIFEHRFRRHDGEYRWQLSRAIPQRDAEGNIQMWVGTSTDIHEMKELDQQKDYFISMASHELKTPITSMKGYVEILQSIHAVGTDEFTKKALASVNRQIDRLTGLISELLDLSRIKSGSLLFLEEAFPLHKLVKQSLDELQHVNPKYKTEFICDTDVVVFADKDRIGQVLSNLLANAVKYSPDNDRLKVTCHATDTEATVSVEDHGVGIAKKDQDRIFERFYRVEGKNEKTFPGFGIGLYIASEIIRRHNGTIGVKSELGKGSVFYFSLPIYNIVS